MTDDELEEAIEHHRSQIDHDSSSRFMTPKQALVFYENIAEHTGNMAAAMREENPDLDHE